MNGLKTYIKNIVVIALVLVGTVKCLQAQSKEYILKAGFLEKFARFSEWPTDAIKDTFRISVIGDNPFENALDEMYAVHQIKNRPVSIKYVSRVTQARDCHLLFIATNNKKNLTDILEMTKSKPIVTVSEYEGFGKEGVHINFYITKKGTIHFEINYNKVKESGIEMDIFLLEYAKIVE